MTVCFTLELPGVTQAQLAEVNQDLMDALLGAPPKGLISHLEAPRPDGITVIDVWDSPQDFDAFAGTYLMPALTRAGVHMQDTPEFREVTTLYGNGVDRTDYAALAQTFYDAMNRKDPALLEMFAEDYVEHDEFPGIPQTREGVQQWLEVMHGAFSDLTITPLEVVGMHGTAAARFRISGRHTGEFQGMPATGRDVSVEGVDIVKLAEDGRAREHWGYMDEVGLLTQLGAIPAQGASSADEARSQART
jgi:steroid delta-isomerase-like uncharacterized protein